MAYIITGTLTFSTQANRDAALTRIQTALQGYSYTNLATAGFGAGVLTPTTTTITISIQDGVDGTTAAAISKAIYDAAVSTNRHSSGYLSINDI